MLCYCCVYLYIVYCVNEGGGGEYGNKRVASVGMMEEDYMREEEVEHDQDYDVDYSYDDEGHVRADTRPIRPKATDKYDDRDPEVDPDGYGDKGEDGVTFPPGQHPLQGVSNLADLPPPEEIRGTNK